MTEYEIPEATVEAAHAVFWKGQEFGEGIRAALQAALPLIDADRREKDWIIIEDREKAVEALAVALAHRKGLPVGSPWWKEIGHDSHRGQADVLLDALSALGGTNDG